MIQIAICDDDGAQLNKTGEIVKQAAACYDPEIDLFDSGKKLLDAVKRSDYRPDIAVLDIVFPEESGIAVAEKLNELCPRCAVIFLTAFLDYAVDVYETKHSYFIVKTQLEGRVRQAIDRALEDRNNDPCLTFRERGIVRTIPLSEVLYLERNLKKTIVVCVSGEEYVTSAKPGKLLEELQNAPFVRCHQSYHVNLTMVRGMTRDSFQLKNGREVPVSRSQYKAAREAFFAAVSRPIAGSEL